MPNFLHEVLLKPSFAEATIRPLDVHFTGGYLRSASREYTGMPINPEISEFELPTLRTIQVDKQAVLDQDLLELRVGSVKGEFVHQNNLNVSTAENPARSALTGWRISGTNPENYELKGSPDIEWTIAPRAVQHWKDIVGAQAGRAVKRFDNTTDFSTEHLTILPRLAGLPLDIDNWDLSFNNQHANPNFYGAHTLTVGNETGVREQLNALIGPNQVLHDDFWFDTLFDAEIFPRILKWNEGVIEPRSYNGGNNITGTIVRPELVASEEGHEIIDHQVFTEYDSSLLDNLVFPSAAPGTHRFDWSEIDMRHVFSDPVHEHNYVVPEIPVTFATIFPARVCKEDILSYGFTVQSREYDGTTEISENSFVANILLDGDYEIQLPYRLEGLRFDEVYAGTNVLDFVNIVFDGKIEEFFEDYEGEIRERIIYEILGYRDAEIEPRRIEWTVGKVANKEWDDTDEVHNILIEPELTRPSRDNLVMNDRAIVARDEGIITKVLGRARFTQTEVGNDIPVNSDGNWNLSTSDADEYPLTNYIFDGTHGAPGEVVQPRFNPANIMPVVVTEIRPMPDDSEDMENNILYVKTGRIEREYNGTPDIDLGEDVQDAPELFLRNARGADIPLSLDDNLVFQVSFFDKDVEYDNGNVTDKPLIISIAGFAHDNITLSDDGLREIERLLFTGRITPQELRTEDVRLGGNRTIHKIYDGETYWEVAEWPDSANPGQTIRAFPELWVEIKETDERIPIRFDENNYAIAFADRHAGPNKSVTIDGFYLDSRNVTLSNDLKAWMSYNLLTGTISPMTIRWTQGQVERRSYDATDNAEISSKPDLPILPIDPVKMAVLLSRGGKRALIIGMYVLMMRTMLLLCRFMRQASGVFLE